MSNTFTSRVTNTRGGTIAVGVAAALIAAVLLVVYLNRYRSSVNESTAQTPVLVAKNLIPKGTSGTIIAQNNLFQTATLAKDDLKLGAVGDPAYLQGRITVADVYPGQQITAGDLSATTTNALPTQISGAQRAIAVPIDGVHAVAGNLVDGDRVDIYLALNTGDRGVLGLLMADMLILRAPTADSTSAVLRATSVQSAKLASGSENGRLWFVLRPQIGAKKTPRILVPPESLLVGLKPLPTGKK